MSSPDDMWFHIHDQPSCHVVAVIPSSPRLDKKRLKKIAVQGAVLCKQYSKYKCDENVQVMYAPIAHVVTTSIPGRVSVEKHHILRL